MANTSTVRRRIVRGPEIEQTHDGRFYVWRGERFWSVTTIINGGVPKPALMGWGIRMVAEAAVRDMAALRVLVDTDPEGAVDWLKGSPWRDRERRARLGSAIHAAAEAHVLDQPWPEAPENQRPYMRAFHAWLEDFAPSFIAVEAPVFSRSQRYAGTLDAIVEIDHPELRRHWGITEDRPVVLLIDYKTGSGVYAETGLQLAAYRYADTFIGLPDGDESPLPAVDACAVVHLQPDAYTFVPVAADEDMFRSFLYVREVYRYVSDLAPGVVGRSIRPPDRAPLEVVPDGDGAA